MSKTRIGAIKNNGHNYEVTISTGTFSGSGTTANVAMTMHGDKSRSQLIPLADEYGNSDEILARGNVVTIFVNTTETMGEINYIRVWHNNKGADPSWFLRQITIRDIASDRIWLFMHNDWFAVDKGDGRIDRRLHAASEKDKTQFKTLFYSHTAKSFSDKHLWISVVLRPPSSTFTSVQRITCCFSLLFTAMLANAMFYQNGDSDADSIQIGPIKISLKQIIIGIESGLVVAPANLLIMTLFRKARPRGADNKDAQPSPDEHKSANLEAKESSKTKEKQRSDKEKDKASKNAKETKKKKNKDNEKEKKEEETKENEPVTKSKEKKKGLPHWVVYIAYALSLISVLASATVVLFYSMMWGTDKSNGWMISVSLSLFQDILVVQPLKVFILAMIFSLIFRKAPEEEKLPEEDKDDNKADEKQQDILAKELQEDIDYEPLESDEVEEVQAYQMKKNTAKATFKEIGLHLTFFLLLSAMMFGSQSANRYQIYEHLDKVFSGSEKVETITKQFTRNLYNTIHTNI